MASGGQECPVGRCIRFYRAAEKALFKIRVTLYRLGFELVIFSTSSRSFQILYFSSVTNIHFYFEITGLQHVITLLKHYK